jgi:hypothetical protein
MVNLNGLKVKLHRLVLEFNNILVHLSVLVDLDIVDGVRLYVLSALIKHRLQLALVMEPVKVVLLNPAVVGSRVDRVIEKPLVRLGFLDQRPFCLHSLDFVYHFRNFVVLIRLYWDHLRQLLRVISILDCVFGLLYHI